MKFLKKLNLFISLVIICLSLDASARENYLDNKKLCEENQGNWRIFNSDCADRCMSKVDNIVCSYNPEYHCDCGEGKCWDAGKCVVTEDVKLQWQDVAEKRQEDRRIEKEKFEADLAEYDRLYGHHIMMQNQPKANTPSKSLSNAARIPEAAKIKTTPILPPAPEKPVTGNQEQIAPEPPKDDPKKQFCENNGAIYKQFNNGCADSCGSKIARIPICSQNITWDCDCGASKCWDSKNKTCILTEEYRKNFRTPSTLK